MHGSLKFEWSLTANPVLQVSAEQDALDLCGSLLVLKRAEAPDNAHVKSHDEPATPLNYSQEQCTSDS